MESSSFATPAEELLDLTLTCRAGWLGFLVCHFLALGFRFVFPCLLATQAGFRRITKSRWPAYEPVAGYCSFLLLHGRQLLTLIHFHCVGAAGPYHHQLRFERSASRWKCECVCILRVFQAHEREFCYTAVGCACHVNFELWICRKGVGSVFLACWFSCSILQVYTTKP